MADEVTKEQPAETNAFLSGISSKIGESTLLSGDEGDGVTTLEDADKPNESGDGDVETKDQDENKDKTDDSDVSSEGDGSEDKGDEGSEEEQLSEEDQKKFDDIQAKIENEEELSDEEQQFYNDNRELTVLEQFGSAFGVSDLSNYEDSLEGVLNMTNDLATSRAEMILQAALAEDPIAAKFYEHYLVNKLPMETFLMETTPTEFEKIDISTAEGQKEMIAARFKEQGLDKDAIDILVKNAETEGKLEEQAKASKKVLKQNKDQKLADQKALDEVEKQKALQQQQKEAKEIQQVLSSGKLLNAAITPQDAAKLKKFVTTTDENGTYIADLAYAQATAEQRLFIDYLLMNNFQVGGLVPAKVAKKTSLDNIVGGKNGARKTSASKITSKGKTTSKSNNGSLGNVKLDFKKISVAGKG